MSSLVRNNAAPDITCHVTFVTRNEFSEESKISEHRPLPHSNEEGMYRYRKMSLTLSLSLSCV